MNTVADRICSDKVYILNPGKGSIHPYMESFARACVHVGIAIKNDIKMPRVIRSAIGHLGLSCSLFPRKQRLLCLGSGRIESVAWPWCYWSEIIPVMWDVWPEYVAPLCRFIKQNGVRLLFCTSKQQTELLSCLNPRVRVVWLPEGVDATLYPRGGALKDRAIDVLEYGRRFDKVHDELRAGLASKGVIHSYGRIGPDFASLTNTIRNSKISICYPQSDTNPARAGGVETLTQRYWECMLSGTLICGRAPLELKEICGYDPCLSIDDNPCASIESILLQISDYQDLADKNRVTAERYADWGGRMSIVKNVL